MGFCIIYDTYGDTWWINWEVSIIAFITVASARRTCGILEAEISNVDVEATIVEVEKQIPRFFNTIYTPTERIEIHDGDGTNRHHLEKNPVLSVRELKIDGTTEDVANLEIYKESGYIFLGANATTPTFLNKKNAIVVKYLHGSLVNSETISTTSSDDEVAGTAISVAVASSTDFSGGNWVEIFGMDGHREAAKISSVTNGTTIVLDQLVQTHESGSTIVKLEIDTNFTKLMNIVCGIALVARIIGQSYSDTTGYSLGELRIQKGEPYTQWREAANQLIKERDILMSRISIRPFVM